MPHAASFFGDTQCNNSYDCTASLPGNSSPRVPNLNDPHTCSQLAVGVHDLRITGFFNKASLSSVDVLEFGEIV